MLQSKELNLNHSQALIHIINANVCHNLWSRGNGKTEGGAGPRINHLSEVMPRSQIIFYSDTFERIHDRLIPNITGFMRNFLGLIEDEDFVQFKKPPDHFAKPLNPINKFEHVITFASGFSVCCASAKVEGSANGYNAQAAIIDEAKFVKESKIKNELYKALRGGLKYFGHLPEYRSVWSFTDKYEGDINWLLKLRDQQNPKLIKAVLTMALDVIEMKNKLIKAEQNKASDSTIYSYKKQIVHKENKLNTIRKEMIFICESKPFENISNIGEKYYRDAKRDCKSIFEYNVAILNQDPTTAEHGYYPNYTPENEYDIQNDVIPNIPLIISMDFNWRIVSLEVIQVAKLPHNDFVSINTVASIHTLAPEGIPELIKLFSSVMSGHNKKNIYFCFDNTAIARDAGRASLKDLTIKEFRLHGWSPKEVYIGQLPDHNTRYQKFKEILQKRGAMSALFNKTRSLPLIKSLQLCGARTVGSKTVKDKRPEVDVNYPAELAPHHTEAWDIGIWAIVMRFVIVSNDNISTAILKGN